MFGVYPLRRAVSLRTKVQENSPLREKHERNTAATTINLVGSATSGVVSCPTGPNTPPGPGQHVCKRVFAHACLALRISQEERRYPRERVTRQKALFFTRRDASPRAKWGESRGREGGAQRRRWTFRHACCQAPAILEHEGRFRGGRKKKGECWNTSRKCINARYRFPLGAEARN